MRLRVVQALNAELVGKEFDFSGLKMVLGRSPECELALADTSLSRRHAELMQVDGRIDFKDLGSANGITVGGKKVAEGKLEPGQRATFGGVVLELIAAVEAAEEDDPIGRTMPIRNIDALLKQFDHASPLYELGEKMVVLAHKPLLLDDPYVAFAVQSGKVEIFTTLLENGQPSGQPNHFLTVEAGQAFFGFDTDRYAVDSTFLARPKSGSELRRFSLDQLQGLVKVPEHRAVVAGWISTWIGGLSRRLTRDIREVPLAELVLSAGKTLDVPKRKVLAAPTGVLWVELPAAQFLFDGMAGLGYEAEGLLFPLGPGAWIELLGAEDPRAKIVFKPGTTEDLIREARLWAGLETFHRLLCECEFKNKKLSYLDEYLRLERKAVHTEKAREQGMEAIGAVLEGGLFDKSGSWADIRGGVDPLSQAEAAPEVGALLRACQAISAFQGVHLRIDPQKVARHGFEETLTAIATAGRFRTRRVLLGTKWWQADQGPMLGQREQGRQPVALIPDGSGGYLLLDPETNERHKVTAEIAAELDSFGYVFYPPLPAGHLEARDLVKYGLRDVRSDLWTVVGLSAGLGLFSTVTPTITGKVFDQAIPQAESGLLLQFCFGLFLVAFSSSAFKIAQSVAVLRVQGKMDYSVQSAVWGRLLDLPLTFFRKYSAGDLADRASGVEKIRTIVAGAGISAILGTVASLFNGVQMLTYNFAMAATGIGLIMLQVFLVATINRYQLSLQSEELGRRGKIAGMVLQLIGGVGKLRVSGAENHAFRVWAEDFAAQRRTAFRAGNWKNIAGTINSGFPVLSSAAIFYVMFTLKAGAAERGETFDMSTGDFLAFNAAFGILLGAMQALADASVNMLQILPIYDRLRPILEAESEVTEDQEIPQALKGAIEVKHLSFRYSPDTPWILNDVSLKIQPGEFVAFVGSSGSGKSTLMRVMLGLEKPETGSVYYDGQDLATLDLRMLRQQIGVVLQESRLIPAEIYRNIVGTSSRTIQDAWEAARRAGFANDVKAMPMQMHTYISEGGGSLSGGQKQRLMIARAIVNNPRVVFLDEATSALDNKTQAQVTQSMNDLAATRLVIAHRLSTIRDAHRIFYLDKGQVRESGTYDELIKLGGLFAELARRQLA